MSFDAWVVGFGLSRTLIDLALIASPTAYGVLLLVVLVDTYLLSLYFREHQMGSLFPVTIHTREEQ